MSPSNARPYAQLRRYAPGLRQAAHRHDAPHISLVMAGGFVEDAGRGETDHGAYRVGLRPDGLRHEVAFGPAGSLILTCTPPMEADGSLAITEPTWSHTLSRERLRTLTPLLLADKPEAVEALWDLMGLAVESAPRRRPDPWLAAVHDRLVEEPGAVSLAALAAHAGRHRVHLGRAFMAGYGEAPSVFRRRAMLNRALCLVARDTSLAQAAIGAGFVDQSHFNRACRDVYGMPPGRLAQSSAHVAFVQVTR